MKFLSIFVTGAIAATVRRQADALPGALQAIVAAGAEVGTAADAYEGEDDQLDALETASAGVLAAITSAQQVVGGIDSLEISDAIALQGTTAELVTTVEGTVEALIAKQPVFAENDDDDDVLEGLQAQAAASSALSESIVSLFPEEVQGLAADANAPVGAAYARAIAAFQEGASTPDGDDTDDTDDTDDDGMTAPAPSEPAPTTYAAPAPSTYAAPAPTGNATVPYQPSETYAPPPAYTGGASAPVAGFFALAAGALVAVL